MAICPTSIPYIKVAKNLLLNEFYLIVVLYYKIRDIFQRKKVLSNTYVLVSHCCIISHHKNFIGLKQ